MLLLLLLLLLLELLLLLRAGLHQSLCGHGRAGGRARALRRGYRCSLCYRRQRRL
jgi:hypothetical protein